MGLRFEANFDRNDINQMIEQQLEKLDQVILNELQFIGLQFVRNARINADFTDRTGNLRSSIGYVITKNGKVVEDDFEGSPRGTEKTQGIKTGRAFAERIVAEFIEPGFALVVVAGMEYAAFVESKGYDVITSSSFKAEVEFKESAKRIKDLISKQS